MQGPIILKVKTQECCFNVPSQFSIPDFLHICYIFLFLSVYLHLNGLCKKNVVTKYVGSERNRPDNYSQMFVEVYTSNCFNILKSYDSR